MNIKSCCIPEINVRCHCVSVKKNLVIQMFRTFETALYFLNYPKMIIRKKTYLYTKMLIKVSFIITKYVSKLNLKWISNFLNGSQNLKFSKENG